MRLQNGAREQRDLLVEKLRAKYAPKLAAAQEQIRKAEQKVEKEKQQASQSTFQAALSVGSSILGAMFGRKLASSTNVTRAASSVRSAQKIAKERADVSQASDTVQAYQEKLAGLEAAFQAEAEKIQQSFDAEALACANVEIKPKKADISVNSLTLLWVPWAVSSDGAATRLES